MLELLNIALEANMYVGIQGAKPLPMSEDAWTRKMKEHRKRITAPDIGVSQVAEDDSMSL